MPPALDFSREIFYDNGMHRKILFILIAIFLLAGFCLVSADDLIHLKNGRVIGVKKFRYEDGWIIMELPGGGEIGTLEDMVAEVEKSSVQLSDYKPREAVEYKDTSPGRRSRNPNDDMMMQEDMREMDREQRRREMRERYERMKNETREGQEMEKEAEDFLDERSPFDQNTRQQREDQMRKMEEQMKRQRR
jgi:hypothetical protein